VRLGRNLLAGLANSVWTAVVTLVVVPLYLKYLGIEAYGLVGFFVTTQALFQILDLGLAPTMNREVARCSAAGTTRDAGHLLHTLAVLYWGMAGLIALAILLLAPFISRYWLQTQHLSPENVSSAVTLMGLVIACRWPIGLYQGTLMGAQRLTVSSGVNMAMTTLGSVGAVCVIAFVSPTIQAFFIWQAVVGFISALTMRWAAWHVVGRVEGGFRFDIGRLKHIWRFSAGMTAIAISSLIFTQLDKLLLSKMLGLADFGRYMLAMVVVGSLYVLAIPAFNTIYPRLSALVVSGDAQGLADLYRLATRFLGAVLFPLAMLLVFYAEDVMYVWTGSADTALSVAPVIQLLAIGTALHGIMHFPYALQLANGMTRIPLRINLILMFFSIPMIIFLASSYGAVGGALAWAMVEMLYVFLGTWLTHRHILKGLAPKWLYQDVGIPFGISLVITALGWQVIHGIEPSLYVRVLLGTGFGIAATIFVVLTSAQLRSAASTRFRWIRNIIGAIQ
jgi:O-antigen/teichoic acid export membrane protein